MKIIINNVYAFQYPTKNRCTILVQPSFAKLVLLPIREAYEWKLKLLKQRVTFWTVCLLPIREAYEWKLSNKSFVNPKKSVLLPIREAYEWKRKTHPMRNGHGFLLPIREAYEWKHSKPAHTQKLLILASNS